MRHQRLNSPRWFSRMCENLVSASMGLSSVVKHQKRVLLACTAVLCLAGVCSAQQWSGILNFVPAGSKNVSGTATDWSLTGLDTSNGLPPDASWTQAGGTIAASACGNGSSDCTSTIQAALKSCGTSHYVLLGPGTFLLSSSSPIQIPSSCVLRGSGTSGSNQTIINITSNIQDGTVRLGSMGDPSLSNDVVISSGATSGSNKIVLSTVPSTTVAGNLMVITELNDTSYVSYPYTKSPGASPPYGTPSEGAGGCDYCDWIWGGTRFRSQIVKITNVSGSTVTFTPPLYTDYTLTPHALPYVPTYHSGLENIYFTENNTHTNRNSPVGFGQTEHSWITGCEFYFMDGDYVKFYWTYGSLLAFNYMDDGDNHGPGSDNQAITVGAHSSANQIVSNIGVRMENTVLYNTGSSGNVFAYNYSTGNYAQPTTVTAGFESHSTHEQFNLLEGNIAPQNWLDVGHGSTSQQTDFRNWWQGTSLYCGGANTKATVVCSSPQWTTDTAVAFRDDSISNYTNVIGDVVSSPAQMALRGSDVAVVQWPATKNYNGTQYGMAFGYTLQSDSGSNPWDRTAAFTTAFIHGVYNVIDGSTTWAGSTTHTLPASFYLSSKPSWWGSLPWPGIGPDISGGTLPTAASAGEPGGFAYMNAAMACYYNVMGGKEGGDGSPYVFDAASCYGSTTNNQTSLQPPTALTAVVN